MKKTLKKTGCLLLCCLLASAATMAQTDSLYVFKKDGTRQTYAVGNVSDLTFSSTDMVVNFKTGGSQSVALTALRVISLRDVMPPRYAITFGAAPAGVTYYVTANLAGLPASALASGATLDSGTTIYIVALPADTIDAIKVNGAAQQLTAAPLQGQRVQYCSYVLSAPITSIEVALKPAGGNNGPTGIASVSDDDAISVYPNPAGDFVTITGGQNITDVALYDLQGQKLLQLESAGATVTVPMAKYPAGAYFIQVTTEQGTATKKVIKN